MSPISRQKIPGDDCNPGYVRDRLCCQIIVMITGWMNYGINILIVRSVLFYAVTNPEKMGFIGNCRRFQPETSRITWWSNAACTIHPSQAINQKNSMNGYEDTQNWRAISNVTYSAYRRVIQADSFCDSASPERLPHISINRSQESSDTKLLLAVL